MLLLILNAALHAAVVLPNSPKDVATDMSVAVQNALSDAHTRIAIATPPALRFAGPAKKKNQLIGDPTKPPPDEWVRAADRELALLVVEMFQAYQQAVVVLFPDAKAQKAAQKEWVKTAYKPRVVSRLADVTPAGFGGGAATPPKVLVLSSPSKAVVAAVEPLTAALPSEVAVVLLNEEPGCAPPDYTPCYTLVDNPHPAWEGGLLYSAYPGPWALAAAGANGAPKVFGTSKQRPTLAEMDVGFGKVVSDTNWFSGAGAAAALQRRAGAVESGAAS